MNDAAPILKPGNRDGQVDRIIKLAILAVGGQGGGVLSNWIVDEAERKVSQRNNGRTLEHTYEVWTGPTPFLTHRDFIVKQTGERYAEYK